MDDRHLSRDSSQNWKKKNTCSGWWTKNGEQGRNKGRTVRTKEGERETETETETERKEGRTRNDNHVEDRTYIPDGGHVAGTRETWSPQELATKCDCLFVSFAIFFCRFVFSLISLSSSLHNTSRARVWRTCGFFVFVSETRISFCLRYHLKECLVFSWFLWTYYRRFLFLLSSGRKCWSYLSRFSWFCFAQDCRELLLGFFY